MQAEWRSGYPPEEGTYLVCGPLYCRDKGWGVERVRYSKDPCKSWHVVDGVGLNVSPRYWLSMPTSGELSLRTESTCKCTCGESAEVHCFEPDFYADLWQVKCCECDLLGPVASKEEAIEKWNIQVFKNAFEKNKDFKPILKPLDVNPAPPQNITHIQGRTFWDWLAEMPENEREGLKVKVGTLFTAILFFASLHAWLHVWG